MENYNNLELLQAKKRVKKIKGFYQHLLIYVCVNTFFAVVNLLKPEDGCWFIFPALGWGIGLFCDAASVFNLMPFLGKEWEDRKMKQFMEEERNNFKI